MNESKEDLTGVEIIPIEEGQIPSAARVFLEAFNTADVGEKWTQETAGEYLHHLWEKQPYLFFVAVHNGAVIGGMSGGIKPWWDGNHVTDTEIFVHPEFQNQGIAKSLLKKILQVAITSYDAVEFEGVANAQHKFPMEWYERIGMTPTGWNHIAGNPREMQEKLQ